MFPLFGKFYFGQKSCTKRTAFSHYCGRLTLGHQNSHQTRVRAFLAARIHRCNHVVVGDVLTGLHSSIHIIGSGNQRSGDFGISVGKRSPVSIVAHHIGRRARFPRERNGNSVCWLHSRARKRNRRGRICCVTRDVNNAALASGRHRVKEYTERRHLIRRQRQSRTNPSSSKRRPSDAHPGDCDIGIPNVCYPNALRRASAVIHVTEVQTRWIRSELRPALRAAVSGGNANAALRNHDGTNQYKERERWCSANHYCVQSLAAI